MELIPTAERSSSDIPETHAELIQSTADAASTPTVVQQQTEPAQVPRRCELPQDFKICLSACEPHELKKKTKNFFYKILSVYD